MSKRHTIQRTIKIIMMLSGCTLYMDWVLPTNPRSKNPVIRKLMGRGKSSYLNCKDRLLFVVVYLTIHITFGVSFYLSGSHIENIFLNIYPSMIQLWIGYRICVVLRHKHRIQNL